MGQGFSLTTLSAGSANIDVPELADLQYERALGTARFMKTIRARHKDGLVVAKVVMKPYADFTLDQYATQLINERKLLATVPNALAYHRILETSTSGYLVRQYIHSSLYDRLSTRPFLEDIEKKWLSFQLLCAVRDCHARGIYHGDIKTENVLVTSWNWLYLTDFSAAFKPAYLPEDNPADFSFYFDMSGRRTGYLAPERFLPPGVQAEGEQVVTWAMDIFSAGCVIAELFLEAPIFSLSQLFKYRQNDYDPAHSHLSKIQDESIRELVTHMIQLDPNSRLSADDYLKYWQGKAFPNYFYGFLQQYMHSITDPSSGRKPVTTVSEHLGEPDDRIEQIYNDYDKISILLSGNEGYEPIKSQHLPPKPNTKLFPLYIDIPNYQHQASPTRSLAVDDGNLIFLTIVVSCLRGTARASARLRGFELLLAFSERLTDEAKLDRVVPYVINHLADKSEQVKIAALRTVTQILAMVQVVSPINAYIFPEYVLQRLDACLPDSSTHPSALVRMHYAWCIGTLATTAARYLDMIQALRADGSLPTTDPEAEDDSLTSSAHRNLFDSDRQNLLIAFERHTKILLTDQETSVRRAMLKSVSDLCVFFGSPRANDVVLSHLNTYLNDRDWMLKCAFFDAIVGVAVFVGGASLEGYILPLMVQALTDPEEFVVEKVIRAFSSIAELGLFQRSKTWELVDIVARLTMHSNVWIREAAAQFISAASKYLSVADTHSILVNLIKPYLKVVPSGFSELRLLDSLKKPLPRLILDMASNWAMHAERGLFWIPAKKQQTFTFGLTEDTVPTVSGRELDLKILQRMQRNEEDDQWIMKLRNAGMTLDDEFKLVALREFIWRVIHRRRTDSTNSTPSRFNNIVALKDLEIIPQTVFFENSARQIVEQAHQSRSREEDYTQPRTIADALLDASTTDADTRAVAQGTTRADTHAERLIREESGLQRISVPTSPMLSSPPGEPASAQDSPTSDLDRRRSSLQVPRSSSRNQSLAGSPGTGDHVHPLRHKGSAITLLNRGDNKALAEIGTTSANAFGKVDGAPAHDASRSRQPSLAVEQRRRSPSRIRFKEAHNYAGNDPTVLKLLDSILLEKLPPDDMEFGPRIQQTIRRQPIKHKDTHQSPTGIPWRPEGILVATFGEHTAAVNRILVAPDHAFFITGSDDGSVKVWDTSRLERNVSRRSRQTYRLGDGVKVSSLVFVEQTYCFVATGNDGSVHVVRVDYYQGQDGSGKFGRLKFLREYQLPDGDFAVWAEHYKDDNKSVLLLATNTSKVTALDLRTMAELFTLKNPLQHGTPTCFCVDRKHHWLLLGTSHGVLDLWDLRFKLRLRAWTFQGAAPIHRLLLPKLKKQRLYITGGTGQGEVTVWDFEKLVCKEVYRTGTSRDTGSKSTTLIDLEEEKSGGMLGRFATSLEPTASASADSGIRSLVVNSQTMDDKGEAKHTFILTAGPDWKVRYWDTNRPEVSLVVSGLEADEAKPLYSTSQPTPDTTVVSERFSQLQSHQGGVGRDGRTSNTSAKRGSPKSSRSGLISLQQQHLLKSHLDTVLDVSLIEQPYGMVISADRSGVVYMFM
ncbi:phosphoinositide 3-kinase regulatory subunit 4 [Lindgomyces ingoldianus]|uniref:Phosphoinositide 3-kinase regulatory subunit 4 n=1 Tax=Lindgomyces ingoldianus TaxID=673940 RepID=A0ACB6QL89_9PLEO|nr:phosphoinositide 3-kinase regulatory subunit 4 [Lindgomyces ingoldianus]KAF2467655.1 phosphoinositide 3-kinase regulatory subunit 4 [Lindgomyces ingoldianus]